MLWAVLDLAVEGKSKAGAGSTAVAGSTAGAGCIVVLLGYNTLASSGRAGTAEGKDTARLDSRVVVGWGTNSVVDLGRPLLVGSFYSSDWCTQPVLGPDVVSLLRSSKELEHNRRKYLKKRT